MSHWQQWIGWSAVVSLARRSRFGCTLVPIGPHAPGEHYVRDPHGVLFDVIERRPGSSPGTEAT